jgi:O-antigen ligase
MRALALVAVGICGSRAAQVGAVAGLFVGCAVRGRRWLLIGLVAAGVLAIALAGRMYLTDARRLQKMADGNDGRWPIWNASLLLIREQPLLGCGGRAAFQTAYVEAFPRANPGARSEFPEGAPHAHNTQLALAAEYGIPAAVLHLGFLGAVLLACWRRRRESPAGWSLACGVVATTLAAGCFEPYPTQAVPGLAGAAALGVALGLASVGAGCRSGLPSIRE